MVADKSKHLDNSDGVKYISADHGCMMNIDGAHGPKELIVLLLNE